MVAPVHTWSVVVNKKPEEVFGYLSDISKHAEWSPKPYSAEKTTEGPVGVGTRYTTVGWLPGKSHTENKVEVTDYQPSTRFGFTSTEGVLTLQHEFDLAADGSGTRVTRTITGMTPPGGFNKVIWPVLFPAYVRPAIQKGMNMFKERAEAAGAATAGDRAQG